MGLQVSQKMGLQVSQKMGLQVSQKNGTAGISKKKDKNGDKTNEVAGTSF